MENQQNNLAGRIATRRTEVGLSRLQLAATLGVEGSAVGNWETGYREPRSVDMLVSLADALKCDVHWLCTGAPRP